MPTQNTDGFSFWKYFSLNGVTWEVALVPANVSPTDYPAIGKLTKTTITKDAFSKGQLVRMLEVAKKQKQSEELIQHIAELI